MRTLPLICCVLFLAIASTAHAADVTPESEYGRRIKVYQTVQPHGETPFGEHVSLYTGDLTFRQADVVVEGEGPTITLARSSVSPMVDARITEPFAFGNWTLSIPRIETLTDTAHGWVTESSLDPAQRCSRFDRAFYSVLPGKGWHGYELVTESGDRHQLIKRGPTNKLFPPALQVAGVASYPIVTQRNWQIGCVPITYNGQAQQGFFAVSPDGVRYWFTHLDYDGAARVWERDMGEIIRQPRRLGTLYVTRIEDRFGNSLAYDFGGDDRLDAITASDGRKVTIAWRSDARLVDRITVHAADAAPRTWRYEYTGISASGATLTRAVLPDGSSWGFDMQASGGHTMPLPGRCNIRTQANATTSAVTIMTHPGGLVGKFWRTGTWHAQSYVPGGCVVPVPPQQFEPFEDIPPLFGTSALTRKEFSGPGLTTLAWTYAYQPASASTTKDACAATRTCAATKWAKVTNPAGDLTTYTFSNKWGPTEGKLLRTDVHAGASGSPVRSELLTYAESGPWPTSLGATFDDVRANGAKSVTWVPVATKQVVQQGRTFTWKANTFDAYANPLSVTRSSNLGSGFSRTDVTAYHHNLALWVVAQPRTSTNIDTGLVESETVHDAKAMPWKTYAFDRLRHTFTYDAKGNLASASDGRDAPNFDTTIRFSEYKRGIPQRITFPDDNVRRAVVNDLGLIASVQDEVGYLTCHKFDAMGRLKETTYPSDTAKGVCDTSKWNATFRSFAPSTTAELGLPAGHWKETVATGSGFQVTHFDALWRPVVVQRFDNAARSATLSQTVTRYAPHGGIAFRSYPQRGIAHHAAAMPGTRTRFDPLGRPTRVEQDSELGVLPTTYEYLAGFQTRVTPPNGHATLTTQYLAFDQPDTTMPLVIAHPEGAITNFSRDLFGKTLSITRRNADSSKVARRTWSFDATQQLCRTTEPETGTTLMGYDAAGNLAWSASGLPANTPCEAEGTSAAVLARRSTRSHDNRNRITTLDFADGIGRQTWHYTADSLPSQAWTWNGPNGAQGVANAYRYNSRRMLAGESLEQAGGSTWSHGYGYDRNGFNSVQVYPDNLTLHYALNGLGQAAGITAQGGGAYASGVAYHPNGALAGFTYGNGIVHSTTQNARGLPDRSRDLNGAMAVHDLGYDYDGNGNVVSISDGLVGARAKRSMAYDGLDRLVSANSPMFSGTIRYTYDVLDNIETLVAPAMQGGVAARTLRYCYSAANRIAFVRTDAADCHSGAAQATFAFDAQGNLASKNDQAYVFAQDNRLRETSGKETYRYDALGRRVHQYSPTLGSISLLYTHGGQLAHQADQRRGTLRDYIYLAGRLIATREATTANNAVAVNYQHTDTLGTPVAVTATNRAVLERSEYEPFGRLLNRPFDDRVGFTGHLQDTQTGLTYMQQRYFDSLLGLFLSVDPVAVHGLGGNFNRYWYANNNPYRYVDPDGRETAMFQGEAYRMPPPDPATTQAALGLIADFTPVVGDVKGLYEALQNPTIANLAGAGIGLVPVAGDVLGKVVKRADNASDTLTTEGRALLGATETGNALKSDAFHRAASFVREEAAKSGTHKPLVGGDGVTRTLTQIAGTLNDQAGRFEFIVDPTGNLTHQLFVPGGTLNGIPIKP